MYNNITIGIALIFSSIKSTALTAKNKYFIPLFFSE